MGQRQVRSEIWEMDQQRAMSNLLHLPAILAQVAISKVWEVKGYV
jgi:hypothetical protein